MLSCDNIFLQGVFFMFAKIYDTEIKIDYKQVDGFNRYLDDIMAEYHQSMEEGLDIEKHKALFESVAAMRNDAIKAKMSDTIYELVINSKIRSAPARAITIELNCWEI